MEARENIVKLISNYINGEKEKNILLAQQQYTTIYKISSSLNGNILITLQSVPPTFSVPETIAS